MYHISEELLKDLQKSIKELSGLLNLAHMGSKLEPNQVKKAIDKGEKLNTLLDVNYLKIEH